MTTKQTATEAKWWDLLAYRRRYLSDRIWFGMGLVVVGLGLFGQVDDWWKAVSLTASLLGAILVGTGIRRAVRHRSSVESATNRP